MPMKTAVVLLNLGGPSTLEEVRPFLFSLFSDPAILRVPNPFRYFLAQLISARRFGEAREIYQSLGGGSPLLKNTQDQATALEETLGEGYKVFVAMRHAAPLTSQAVQEVKAYGPDKVVLLPLYPQYSTTTTASSFQAWHKESKRMKAETLEVQAYPTEEGFLDALTEKAVPVLKKAKEIGDPQVLLTAHSLPEKIVKQGDPYQKQVEETAAAFIERVGLFSDEVVLCYQSRVGPLKWIGPETEKEIKKASREKRPLVVVPLSFVSEHSETLVELDMTYRKMALEVGCPFYGRVSTVQTHPSFIRGLSKLVKNAREGIHVV